MTSALYRIKAYNLIGESAYSEEVCGVTPSAPDPEPDPDPANETTNNTLSSSNNVCFIATAAYGTHLADEVESLCQFRDQYLLHSAYGENFVALYYKYSPPIANQIAKKDCARMIMRIFLRPLVKISEMII